MPSRNIVALTAIATLCVTAACTGSATDDWPSIDASDFRYITENDGIRYYVKPVQGDGHPRLWLRMEHRQPEMAGGRNISSAVILTEFDCEKRLSRDLEITAYPQNNMKGRGETAREDVPWEPVQVASALGDLIKIACESPDL